jgi:mannose-6-phosphate isomerase-like protein (cupin superfamily)
MRGITIGLGGIVVIGLSAAVAVGQRGGGGQTVIRQQAPTDKAVDFPLAELNATFKEMDDKKLSTMRLLEGGAYNVNIRRLRGGETALIHPKTTDVWVVQEGSGTLVTGGVLVDARGQPVQGESAAAIRGGVERVIKTGDVIYIPAGVPHGVKESQSITWLNVRFDTK